MASVDFFLKIDGIAGESTDDKHKGEIELDSWSFGATNSSSFSSGGGAGVGKVQVSEFKFKKKVDKASANLFTYCCTGEHPKTATLVCRKAGKDQQEFLKIEMGPVYISAYDIDGSSGDEVPWPWPTARSSSNTSRRRPTARSTPRSPVAGISRRTRRSSERSARVTPGRRPHFSKGAPRCRYRSVNW